MFYFKFFIIFSLEIICGNGVDNDDSDDNGDLIIVCGIREIINFKVDNRRELGYLIKKVLKRLVWLGKIYINYSYLCELCIIMFNYELV